MNPLRLLISSYIFTLLFPCLTRAEQRFDLPIFAERDKPQMTTPFPRETIYEYLDVIVLVAALSLASYLSLKRRSRTGIFLLMIFSLGYFGFYREGCVCPIGAIQNVTAALFDSSYTLPYVVLAFFLLPLIFTLLFGRSFCGAVDPGRGVTQAAESAFLASAEFRIAGIRVFRSSGTVCRDGQRLYHL